MVSVDSPGNYFKFFWLSGEVFENSDASSVSMIPATYALSGSVTTVKHAYLVKVTQRSIQGHTSQTSINPKNANKNYTTPVSSAPFMNVSLASFALSRQYTACKSLISNNQ
jgi:hypothetical protein